MHVEFDLPDDIAQALGAADLSRAALEAIAIEGYRSRRLGGGQVRHILGFTTPMQVHEFLYQHDVPLNYGIEEYEQDIATNERLFGERTPDAKSPA